MRLPIDRLSNFEIKKTLIYQWFVIAILLALLLPMGKVSAQAPVANEANQLPILAESTTDELIAKGCVGLDIREEERIIEFKNRGWQFVVPADLSEEKIYGCPENIYVAPLVSQSGQVAGINTAQAQIPNPNRIALQAIYNLWSSYFSQTPTSQSAFDLLSGGSSILDPAFWALKALDIVVGSILIAGNFVHYMLSWGLVSTLGLSSFVTNKVVTQFWTTALGIANLGFMLALVTIALFTVLRIDIGGGVRRLLPRLLLGAILVNFSLIIAGLILDFIRLLMALMPLAAGFSSLATLPKDILTSFNLAASQVAGQAQYSFFGGYASSMILVLSAIAVWFVNVVMAMLVIGLLIRYIALLALLIVSPFAYLFIAFPGMNNLAKQWWLVFLRYAFYGPIALFFILAGMALVNDRIFANFLNVAGNPVHRIVAGLLDATLLSAFLYLAAVSGKKVGIAGSTAVVNAVGKQSKRLARTGGGAALKGAYVGSGARRGRRYVGDYAKEKTKGIRKALSMGEYSDYGKDGKKKPGRVSEGQRRAAAQTTEGRAARTAAADTTTPVIGNTDLSAKRLGESNVKKALRRSDIDRIMVEGDDDQRLALAVDVNMVRMMDDSTISDALSRGGPIADKIERAIRQINRQDNA